jgi:TPR repeat protein
MNIIIIYLIIVVIIHINIIMYLIIIYTMMIGIGCERNDKLCMHYYKQAADLDYPEGLFMLG